jgi:uncharacterized protein (DUF488 family)
MRWQGLRVYTVGHSTRTADELVELLRAFDVSLLIDVRTIPRSRHNPQFEADALRSTLRRHRLGYIHIPELGGLRHTHAGSINDAWRNASFRGFADYMQSEGFEAGLEKLRTAAERTPALMCAEAVPWRCHRSLIADALIARGATVEHILGPGRSQPHRLTPFAHLDGTHVTYPAQPGAAPP